MKNILAGFTALFFALAAGASILNGGAGVSSAVTSPCSYPLPNASNTVVAAYGLRKLRSAYAANKAINIIRASDSATQDIGFSGCDFDTATANTFCTATTCKITKWYDQSGGSIDLAQATGSKQPALTFSCLNGFPCATFTGTSSVALTGTLGAGITSSTYAAVADITSITQSPQILLDVNDGGTNATQLGYSTGTGGIYSGRVVSGTSTRGFKANSTSTWYAITGTNTNTLASVYLNGVKGTDVTTSVTLVSGTSIDLGGHTASQFWTGSVVEAIVMAPSISITDSNTLNANQRTYWGLP